MDESNIALETNLSARFISKVNLSPEEQASLDALNFHAEEITQRLQSVFRTLVTEMLDLKRAHYAKERG